MKKKYYVDLISGEITGNIADHSGYYTIYADDREASELKAVLDRMHDWDLESYFRAHVPIMPYHSDMQNKNYDRNLLKAFQMLYELGDEQAKAHVQSLGIVSE